MDERTPASMRTPAARAAASCARERMSFPARRRVADRFLAELKQAGQ